MNILKTFFEDYKKSFLDFSSYKKNAQKPFLTSVRFLYLLTVIVFFIYTFFFAVNAALMLPKLPGYLSALKLRSEKLYPKDLIITIQDGVINTNKKQPLYFDIPELQKNPDFTHFIVIDTNASPKNYQQYHSLLLITKHAFLYPTKDPASGEYEIKYAKDLENTIITYERYQTFIRQFHSFADIAPTILPWILFASVFVIPLFASFFVVVWRLMNLGLLTVIVWAVSTIFGNKYSYKDIYKMGIYGLAIPITVTGVLNLFGLFIPLLFTASFLLWMVIVVSKLDSAA